MTSSPLRRDGRRPAPGLTRIAATARDRLPSPDRMVRTVTAPARALAFWSAIALPVLNLALLLQGLSTASETAVFLGLLVANLVALLVGHPHRAD